ncbi:hypothetical protein, partial [Haloquadratum walsbyi]|uniref:hypothetical protein n=1 Tax=Haloquadratum walsbyi TaxID=293091 RepID=UPI0023F225E4
QVIAEAPYFYDAPYKMQMDCHAVRCISKAIHRYTGAASADIGSIIQIQGGYPVFRPVFFA